MPPTTRMHSVLRISFGHSQIAIFTLLLGGVFVLLGLTSSDPVEANRISIPIEMLPSTQPAIASADAVTETPGGESLHDSERAPNESGAKWLDLEVNRGDNLSLIFARAGARSTDLQLILDTPDTGRSLRSIFPGQTISFKVDTDGKLLELRYAKSPLETFVFTRADQQFEFTKEIHTPEIHRAFRHATISSSLFNAGQDAGLSGRLILELANIFGGVIDFVLDPRAGDSFSVLFEERYLNGEKIGEGSIIAAEFVNDGRHYSAFHYVSANGNSGYFSEDGVSMRKAFLRAPLDFTRVSSNFNMRRLHPIAKVIRPHRGVDYAASTGTPVYASGDGKVAASGYSRSNGNYVFIQHDGRFMTRYLHLHKRTVQSGQRVKQGQTIGTVGSTGLATGPHLHYEFLVDGIHRNPRDVLDKLPLANKLATAEIPKFKSSISSKQTQLASYAAAWELAVASSAN